MPGKIVNTKKARICKRCGGSVLKHSITAEGCIRCVRRVPKTHKAMREEKSIVKD